MTTRHVTWIAAALAALAALAACGGRSGAPAAAAPGATPSAGRSFDREAAEVALSTAAQAAARECPQPGQAGIKGPVKVTFAPEGMVTEATTDEPWLETPIGQCALSAFSMAVVPPFDGRPVTMTTSVDVP